MNNLIYAASDRISSQQFKICWEPIDNAGKQCSFPGAEHVNWFEKYNMQIIQLESQSVDSSLAVIIFPTSTHIEHQLPPCQEIPHPMHLVLKLKLSF